MPLLTDRNLDKKTLATNHYGYSATRMADLGASEYTLVTIACDTSGSVSNFQNELTEALKRIVQACQFSPRADNLLLRLVEFNSQMNELHGFKLLPYCHLADYNKILNIGGSTALFDAVENAVSATTDYAKQLAQAGYAANAIVFVLTDGCDNVSTLSAQAVKQALCHAVAGESLESMVSILVGVNVQDANVSRELQAFHTGAGFTQYVEIGRADAPTLARLADFVSRSISLQSSMLGTGGPSRSLTF
jgi:hypothetical protein